MGLADALAAGLGQGLSQGANNYVDGLANSQKLAQQQQTFQNQQTEFQQQQAQQRLQGLQGAAIDAGNSGNFAQKAALANQIPGAYGTAFGIPNMATTPDVVGKPVATPGPLTVAYGGPAQGIDPSGNPQGPVQSFDAQSQPRGLAAALTQQTMTLPGTPQPNDFSGQQTQDAINAKMMLGPQMMDLKYGEQKYLYDPASHTAKLIAGDQHQFRPSVQVRDVPDGKGGMKTVALNNDGSVAQDYGSLPSIAGEDKSNFMSTPNGLYNIATKSLVAGTGPDNSLKNSAELDRQQAQVMQYGNMKAHFVDERMNQWRQQNTPKYGKPTITPAGEQAEESRLSDLYERLNPTPWNAKRQAGSNPFSPPAGAATSPDVDNPLPTTLTPAYNGTGGAAPTSGPTTQWAPQINAASQATGVPPGILHAVMKQESGGNAQAKSPAGALGLMQLMPGTAQGLGVDPSDPAQNVMGGAKYLAQMKAHFGDWDSALAAYNAGPGALAPSKQNPKYQIWQAPYNKGYQETRDYVAAIKADLARQQGGK